ncbi:MAG: TIGR04211 family SH3 domain-containing protein [Thermodesulfobacteriota bacterium]|nr:TIGR04211 family SH3 domain-containing protein [Thermodesulfobacteriota bacterium]
MIKVQSILVIVLGIFLMPKAGWADRAYVTDSFEITLRSGPSIQNRVLTMPTSAQAVEILDTQDTWSHIRLVGGPQADMEGWVLSRYLVSRLPWKLQSESLEKNNALLAEKLAVLEKEYRETSNREKELVRDLQKEVTALKKLKTDYESLKSGAANYVKLKAEYDKTSTALGAIQKKAQELTKENDGLKFSQRNKWFATGAAVLLIGLITGLMLGRREKKRKSLYY